MIKPLIICLFFSLAAFAQFPETDIWLFKIEKKEGKYIATNPLNITHRLGYDNQPAFALDDKSILYVRIDSSKQADIYQYHIIKKTDANLTKSQVSEYSPTLIPGGLYFSSIVVEKDSSQRVWQYAMDGTFQKIVHEGTDSIGYHTWLNADTMLYYKLTEPHSLRSLDLKTNKDVWICNHPTRAFKKINNSSNFIYGIKDTLSTQFRNYNPALKESTFYSSYPSVNEDFIWHSEFGLIKSEGADLLLFNEKTFTWEILFSFSKIGIKKITRFVFDSKTKQLAIVSNL